MPKSIGIDLGTTNSVGAIKKVRTEVLENSEGDLITPSCVALRSSKARVSKPEFVVGKHALEWMKQDPKNTVLAIKRLMGRNYQDEAIQDILSNHKLRYQIKRHFRGSENSLAVVLGGKEYTPEEISAEILKKIRLDAEKALEDGADCAVITVPAYFNDKQKHATRTAAYLAGLKVHRLLPEPTAAAISFGVDTVKGEDAKTVLIFDFGGGTLDLSALTISGGGFIEHGKGGNMWLGGDDIDRLIADFVLEKTAEQYRIDNIEQLIESQDEMRKNRFLGELRAKAEQAKIRLSAEKKVHIDILGVLKDNDGDSVDVELELTRDRFDELIAPMIETIIKLTQKMLADIDFTPALIDSVLLVGGSAQIPSLAAALEREFGKDKVLIHERPMLAIAEGAAILSHRLSDSYECPGCGGTVSQSDSVCKGCGFDLIKHTIEQGVLEIIHATAHDYYIRLENDERYLFIEKNTPLPCEKSEVFKLIHPEQRLVHMKFYNTVNDKEESIGDLWLGLDVQKEDKGNTNRESLHVEIALKIDENNLVEVTAAMKEHSEIQISKYLSRGKADEMLYLSLEETIDKANSEKYSAYVMVDLLHRALSSIKDINDAIDPETDRVNEKLYRRARLKIEKAQKMAAEGRTSKATIFYAKSALGNFGPAIPAKIRKEIRAKVQRLEKMDEKGSYEDNLKALEELEKVLSNKLGVVEILMEIQKAGAYYHETNPARAAKFFQYVGSILQAFEKGDTQKAHTLIDEIMPEVDKTMQAHETETRIIYKDITR